MEVALRYEYNIAMYNCGLLSKMLDGLAGVYGLDTHEG